MSNTNQFPTVIVKDGVATRLDTMCYNTVTRDGRVSMAPTRGGNVEIDGRDGELYAAGKTRDSGRIVLEMWVRGTDPDGYPVPGEDPYITYRKNLDFLLGLFDTTMGRIEFREYLVPTPQGSSLADASKYRRAFVDVSGAITPKMQNLTTAGLTVELTITDTYREDGAQFTYTSVSGTAAIGTHRITELDGASAPLKDMVLCIDGPIQNPILVDTQTGHSLKLAATVPAGQQWSIDTTTFESRTGIGINFDTGLSGVRRPIETLAQGYWLPRLFAVSPSPNNTRILLQGTGATSTTRLRIRGRKRYH